MTRKELDKELNKINIFIEVLRDLVEKPLCGCISHISSFNEQFKKDNKEQLNALVKMKYFLISLETQSDDVLDKLVYEPVE
mgnify:CR=1 FL=1